MPTYIVTRKSDGQQVYSYGADGPIEWSGFEFSTHDHVAQTELTTEGNIVGQVAKAYSQVEWLRRLTATERIAIRQAAAENLLLDDYIKLMDATTVINPDDPDTIAGVNMLETVGLIAAGRAEEILHGR